MTAPLYERLSAYAKQKRISFAMPGHKNGRGLKKNLLSLDVTELDTTENLYHPRGFVRKAQKMLSELYGSDKSYILTGGSTAGVHAMICGAVKAGGTILAGCDCHMSVINICALLGINIRFFPKETDSEFLIPLGTETIDGYLTDDIDAVIITSPNYYGMCSNIKNIAEECHRKNIPLLVDEAHGAHFIADGRFPETAVRYADAVCQSAHKTLNALNGAGYLHINGQRINRGRLEESLSMLQSSSPSYVTASSADTARAELSGKNKWEKTYDMCREFKEKVSKLGILTLDNDDMTRIVLNFSRFDITGFCVSEMLSERKIDIETADAVNAVLIVTQSNRKSDLRKLLRALKQITKRLSKRTEQIRLSPPPVTEDIISPRTAFYAETEEIEFLRSEGRVSGVSVTPYPPGVPVIHTGETIRGEQIEYICKMLSIGAEITGLTGNNITVTAETENE